VLMYAMKQQDETFRKTEREYCRQEGAQRTDEGS
jgi:hypothetical protein